MGGNPVSMVDPDGDAAWFAPILVGAAIGAGTSGAVYSVTAAISGDWTWKGFGQSIAAGAIGGAISGGIGQIFAGSAFAQKAGFEIIQSTASNVATSAAFGQDITLSTLAGGFAGGLVGSALPTFRGVNANGFTNAIAELGAESLRGGITGGVAGFTRALFEGQNPSKGFVEGAKRGAIGEATIAGIRIAALGPTILPSDNQTLHFSGPRPVYRRGWFPDKGITFGRQLSGREGLLTSYEEVMAHETAHYNQIIKHGFGGFYGRWLGEAFRFGFYKQYYKPGTLEFAARHYGVYLRSRIKF